MFGFKRRESPPIQLYGKLPLAKDYLRLGLGEGAGLMLREWLDAAFSGAAPRDATQQLAWPARFLAGEAWRTCLQGVLVPSSDAGGHRSFPFMICVERRRRAVLEDRPHGFAVAGGVWEALRELRETCAAQPDGRSLLDQQRGAELDLEALRGVPSTGVDAESWLQAIWPDQGRAGLEQDLDRLSSLRGDAMSPLRLPLTAGCSLRQQVLAWLEVLARLGLIDPDDCPTIFFPERVAAQPTAYGTDGAPLFVTVFRAAPQPAHGRWLSEPANGAALGAGDLVAARARPSSIAALATEGLPPLADSLRSTVSNFLRRSGGRGA